MDLFYTDDKKNNSVTVSIPSYNRNSVEISQVDYSFHKSEGKRDTIKVPRLVALQIADSILKQLGILEGVYYALHTPDASDDGRVLAHLVSAADPHVAFRTASTVEGPWKITREVDEVEVIATSDVIKPPPFNKVEGRI